MAKPILATTPLSYNDIKSLAYLFGSAFQRFNGQNILSEQAPQRRVFFQQVRTVIGLAFTAALVDQQFLALFKPHLTTFLRHQPSHSDSKAPETAGIALSDMISLGSDAFRTLEHPEYYAYFLRALRHCLRYCVTELNIPLSSELNQVIALIMADE